MPLCRMSFYSLSLDEHKQMNVIVPPGRGPYPVLYVLHGLSDDHDTWIVRTRIERYVDGRRLMVVFPNAGRSFYVNDPRPGGHRYEDHIIQDVIGQVDRTFPTIRSRRSRAVAGQSMGGYGAMMLAMRHAEKFSAAVSHSGAFRFGNAQAVASGHADINALSAASPRGKYDLFALARNMKKSRRKLALRIDCGADDFLIESNRRFHAHLGKLGIAHEYAEHPGEHNWDYWEEHIGETIRFVLKHLKRSPA